MVDLAYDVAAAMKSNISRDNVIFSASHTHSGPGAIGGPMLWAMAPATDLLIPELQRKMANSIADAMIQAEQNLREVVIDLGRGTLVGATHNRRADISPYVNYTTVDTRVGVIRVDDAKTGKPYATLWNFAIHGICFDEFNMKFSSDVMGSVNDWVEENVGGTSFFVNADAGDVNPVFSVSCNNPPNFSGGKVIGSKVSEIRATLKPSDTLSIAAHSHTLDFGLTQLNLTLARVGDCKSGGPLDICSICFFLNCDLNLHLGSAWVETRAKLSAVKITVNNKNFGLISIPGEALTELGRYLYDDMAKLGFDDTFLLGYSNNYMGYFAPPDEYDIGSYESALTFWGINTTVVLRNSIISGAKLVRNA